MHYFNNLLYRLKNEYNLFLADDALIEIYSNCEKEILYENLDLLYNNSLKNIYLLAYTAKKRSDDELLKYTKTKFYKYNEKKTNITDEYYYFLSIMFDDIKDLERIFCEDIFFKHEMNQYNKILLKFRNIKEIKKIYRKSSKYNKKKLSLFLAFHYLKNNEKRKFMYFLFNVIEKDVCLKKNTININYEDEDYFNLYFSYFLKCFYLTIKKGSTINIEILNNNYNPTTYLTKDIKKAIESIINHIINNKNINFINTFNSGNFKNINNIHYYNKKQFNEFRILLSCLVHSYNKPKDLININSINSLLKNKNIEKINFLKVNEFLKVNLFDNKLITNIKNKIKIEITSKEMINYLEGSENEYISLFKFLNEYKEFDSNILSNFCKVSLSYEYNKDQSINSLIYSLSYLADIDRKNTLILLNDILPVMLHIHNFTNLSELDSAISLFNSLLDKLWLKTEKKDLDLDLDLESINKYKISKTYLIYDEDKSLNDRMNKRSESFDINESAENYLNKVSNWYPSIYFPDDFFYYIDDFLSTPGNKIEPIIEKIIYQKNSYTFPYDKLVYVFCKNGSKKKALNLTKMLVKTFIEETEHLILKEK